jgi:hypothetical protein
MNTFIAILAVIVLVPLNIAIFALIGWLFWTALVKGIALRGRVWRLLLFAAINLVFGFVTAAFVGEWLVDAGNSTLSFIINFFIFCSVGVASYLVVLGVIRLRRYLKAGAAAGVKKPKRKKRWFWWAGAVLMAFVAVLWAILIPYLANHFNMTVMIVLLIFSAFLVVPGVLLVRRGLVAPESGCLPEAVVLQEKAASKPKQAVYTLPDRGIGGRMPSATVLPGNDPGEQAAAAAVQPGSSVESPRIPGTSPDRVLVPAHLPNLVYGHLPERGLLVFDRHGITYASLAHSKTVKAMSFLAMLGVVAGIAALVAGFQVASLSLLAFLLAFVMWLAAFPFKAAMEKRALAQEKQVKIGGIASVKSAGAEWQSSWQEVVRIHIYPPRRSFTEVMIEMVDGKRRTFHLFAGDEAFNISGSRQAAQLVRDAVTGLAPDKLESL